MSRADAITRNNYQYYETDSIRDNLEAMAAKGYILSGMNSYVFKFRKSDKDLSNVRYSVVHYEEADKAKLKEQKKKGGWRYVCRTGVVFVFISERANAKEEIKEPAHYNEVKDIRRRLFINAWSIWAVACVIVCAVSIFLLRGEISFKTPEYSYVFFVATGLFITFMIYYIGELGDYAAWTKLNDPIAIEGGEIDYERTYLKSTFFIIGDICSVLTLAFAVLYGIYAIVIGTAGHMSLFVPLCWLVLVLYFTLEKGRAKGAVRYIGFCSAMLYIVAVAFHF